MSLKELKQDFLKLKDEKKAMLLQRFFKTGKGEYGEGDIFLGIVVPRQRELVKKYWDKINLDDIQVLLNSRIHEHRLTALLILVKKYKKANEKEKHEIFNFYLSNTKNINNWDLVDLSAPNIVGNYILALNKNPDILFKLANSSSLWEKRISILATFEFIKNNRFDATIKIAEILMKDKHDLIHKAVGWMLREIGKREVCLLESFLAKHNKNMPRTMLRYAIEKLPEAKRQFFLNSRK